MKMTIIIALLLFSSTASAGEVFDCSNGITLTIMGGSNSALGDNRYKGAVDIDGDVQSAVYSLSGIIRRWVFFSGPKKFIIELKPDGEANYFDMSLVGTDGIATSTFKFFCSRPQKEEK